MNTINTSITLQDVWILILSVPSNFNAIVARPVKLESVGRRNEAPLSASHQYRSSITIGFGLAGKIAVMTWQS